MTAGEGTPKRGGGRFSSAFAMSRLADVGASSSSPRRRRRCLFGAPDRDETERLVAEQYRRDRRRYIKRFNFDIETESAYGGETVQSPPCIRSAAEALSSLTAAAASVAPELVVVVVPGTPRRRPARSPMTPRTPRTPAKSPRTPRTPRRSPRTPASRRQLHMTDYWTIRKCADSSPSDKEN